MFPMFKYLVEANGEKRETLQVYYVVLATNTYIKMIKSNHADKTQQEKDHIFGGQ